MGTVYSGGWGRVTQNPDKGGLNSNTIYQMMRWYKHLLNRTITMASVQSVHKVVAEKKTKTPGTVIDCVGRCFYISTLKTESLTSRINLQTHMEFVWSLFKLLRHV